MIIMVREKINLTTKIQDVIITMSEGNPGSLRVLMELFSEITLGMFNILNLDDMNIRGSQIWAGYKDFCKEDLQLFINKIKYRDRKMVDFINSRKKDCETDEIAVTSGASYK